MSGQGSPVQSEAKSDPRRSAPDARLAIATHPAGLRLRGSLYVLARPLHVSVEGGRNEQAR